MQFELEVGFKPICAIWQLRGRMRSTQPNTTLHLTALPLRFYRLVAATSLSRSMVFFSCRAAGER